MCFVRGFGIGLRGDANTNPIAYMNKLISISRITCHSMRAIVDGNFQAGAVDAIRGPAHVNVKSNGEISSRIATAR